MRTGLVWLALGVAPAAAFAQIDVERATRKLESRVIETRRDLHQHPELSNRETRTAFVVAERLSSLGMEVRTGIAMLSYADTFVFGITAIQNREPGINSGRTAVSP